MLKYHQMENSRSYMKIFLYIIFKELKQLSSNTESTTRGKSTNYLNQFGAYQDRLDISES